MDIKMIDGKAFEKLRNSVNELVELSKKLNSLNTPKKWLDNQEVCLLLGISLRTLQTYRDKGLLPYSQIAHKCYYKENDIILFIESNKVKNDLK